SPPSRAACSANALSLPVLHATSARGFTVSSPPALGPAVPEDVRDAAALVLVARHHEEGIGEPVQVADRPLADGVGARERDEEALAPPAHRPRDVQLRRARRAARKNEVVERREL